MIDAIILTVVVLAIPLALLVRTPGDRAILGELANGPIRSAIFWAVTGGLLAMGLWSALGTFGILCWPVPSLSASHRTSLLVRPIDKLRPALEHG